MAAILSAGIGLFLLGFLAFLAVGSKAVKSLLDFYPPASTLSGITTLAVAGWFYSWTLLYLAWRDLDVNFNRVFFIALVLIGLGLLLMFPPLIKLVFPGP